MSDNEAAEGREPVKSIVTPVSIEYTYRVSGTAARFLEEISKGRIIGARCPSCSKVYVPAKGTCARCGVETNEEVEVRDRGTVTTFCVVRVPSENIDLKLPYVAAHILLDGADIPFFSLVQECEAEDVRMGMRVEAVWLPREEWGPTLANIQYFRPIDEPDVPYDAFKEHL
jgi:uncharacterized OB-fold protein